jgi:hypothetical protein
MNPLDNGCEILAVYADKRALGQLVQPPNKGSQPTAISLRFIASAETWR